MVMLLNDTFRLLCLAFFLSRAWHDRFFVIFCWKFTTIFDIRKERQSRMGVLFSVEIWWLQLRRKCPMRNATLEVHRVEPIKVHATLITTINLCLIQRAYANNDNNNKFVNPNYLGTERLYESFCYHSDL